MRFPRNTSITLFAGITRAVECGFIAAGVTVAGLAAIQSVTIVLRWIASL